MLSELKRCNNCKTIGIAPFFILLTLLHLFYYREGWGGAMVIILDLAIRDCDTYHNSDENTETKSKGHHI